ncbi:MAG: PIG-L deacetylase family protein [Chloroflexota bacterium]
MENSAVEVLQGGPEAFKDVQRAIVVCAHADDMETMMGGTAWLLQQRGVDLYELICTRGDLGTHDPAYTRDTLAAARAMEAREGGGLLGFKEVVTLEYHDGELEPSLELRAQITQFYRRWQADTLFTFDPSWAGQIHADHRAAGRAALDALMPSRMELYHPEQLEDAQVGKVGRVFLFSPAEATLNIDVTDVYDKKLAASLAHVSQFQDGEKSLEWMRALDTQAAEAADMAGRLVERFSELRLW